MISVNAARHLRGADEIEAMITEIEQFVEYWDIIGIQEFDGFLCDRALEDRSPHYVVRHWPGQGSFAMGWIIHKNCKQLLRTRAVLAEQ